MRSMHSLLFTVPALLLAILSAAPVTPTDAVASPAPLPMPLRAADYRSDKMLDVPTMKATRIIHGANYSSTRHHSATGHINPTHGEKLKTRVKDLRIHRNYRRDDAARMKELQNHRDSMLASARRMKALADQSTSTNRPSAAYTQDVATEPTRFYSSAQSFNSLLEQLSADKGLAFYDKNNEVEVLLKDVINAHKNILTSISVIVFNLPALGPVLGPIVYDLKCLIDVILNIIENATDAILNALAPILAPLLGDLLGHLTSTLCASGIKLLGLCLF